MPVEILMPELGESVHEATVSRWLVKEGDFVKEDDPVVEIMTDKVNTELPSPATGVLAKILVPEGGSVHVFEPMGLIEEASQQGESASGERTGKPESAVGGEPAIVAPRRETSAAPSDVERVEAAPAALEARPAQERRWFTPVVRSMAKEHGISEDELATIAGTGAGGRVTKKDLETFIARGLLGQAPQAKQPTEKGREAPAGKGTGPGEVEIAPLSAFRKMLAEAMVRANAVPTVSTCVHVDVTTLVRFREANKEAFRAEHGVKLTYTPFFIKALTEALLEFPTLNSSLDGDKLTLHKAVHMGVAVALGENGDEGLIVPVIRDCHNKGLVEIARDLEKVAAKARTNSLSPSDVQGGTFTLTNPGSYGALFGTPMIVAPQAGIAGAYGIQKTPVVVGEDAIAVRHMMYFVLTYDHRVVDGLLAGRFLQSVKRRLEEFDFFR